ncbi:hypothetical protein PUR71_36965 [Streptomyces sp. SP17BM10]|uniref:hypothetical protein n=1 Tax=Streptomyces sp. SP17BM10 TaxID=3002530 RepID=UPI002E78B8E2|nr:hypothetical protein [Streptomyces sp. SP17BM10]MEE1788451.1 hypothetical protein [Streptomyces sp. SP17BM10]
MDESTAERPGDAGRLPEALRTEAPMTEALTTGTRLTGARLTAQDADRFRQLLTGLENSLAADRVAAVRRDG